VERIDAGPILEQRLTPVLPTDTAGALAKRLVAAGLEAMDTAVARLSAGDSRAVVPDLARGSYEPPVQAHRLDLRQPFAVLERHVRAGQPDQRPVFSWKGEELFAEGVRRLEERGRRRVGLGKPLAENELLAVCADAMVAVRWCREGHRHATRPLRKQQFP
jgi:methionyl-tRNA formyltransferase